MTLRCTGTVEVLFLLSSLKNVYKLHPLKFFILICSISLYLVFTNNFVVCSFFFKEPAVNITYEFCFCIYIYFSFIILIFWLFWVPPPSPEFLRSSVQECSFCLLFSFLFCFDLHFWSGYISLSFALAVAQLFWCFHCILVVFKILCNSILFHPWFSHYLRK